MKTIFAAAFAAATLVAGVAHASETTHNGAQVRAATVQPIQSGEASGFGGVSFDRTAGATNGSSVADPARNANSGT
jgi:outer membrane protein W